MRFDTPVYFQRIHPGDYREDTGDYGPDVTEEEGKYANVTSAGTETLQLVYGEIRQGCKVVRLQKHYRQAFDRIRIGEKTYRVDSSRKLRNKHVFIVSEIQ